MDDEKKPVNNIDEFITDSNIIFCVSRAKKIVLKDMSERLLKGSSNNRLASEINRAIKTSFKK